MEKVSHNYDNIMDKNSQKTISIAVIAIVAALGVLGV
jgi:hypothetical protein